MAPKRYVPISLTFAHDTTGTHLLREFGNDGLLVWVCLLAAAKRNTPTGTYVLVTDALAWADFGLQETPPGFTMQSFLRATGRMKQTSCRAHGRLTYVTVTHFSEWNNTLRRDKLATEKARKRALSTVDTVETPTVDKKVRECEVEGEYEYECEVEPRTQRVLSILAQIPKSGYMELKPERIQRAITAYPAINHEGEAHRVVDWETSDKNAGKPCNDGARRYLNWLSKAVATPTTTNGRALLPHQLPDGSFEDGWDKYGKQYPSLDEDWGPVTPPEGWQG